MSQWCSIEQAVERVLRDIPGPIRLGLPLGLGKPNRWVNALYARIKGLPERRLTIYTALCLERPGASHDLQRRFLEPVVERIYGDYPELDFLADLRAGRLPANVHIEQFYLQPGSLLDCPAAQQDYISCNYSHVARDLNDKGVNLIAQLVACDPQRPQYFSLSCNPDITLDLLPLLAERRGAGEHILCLAQVHEALPYMAGAAQVRRDSFDLQVREVERTTLFSTPNMPVGVQDHCIGLHASSLIRDGGTLQIGIGSMGDALSAALLARHRDNAGYRSVLTALQGASAGQDDNLGPFAEGLYGCSEMFAYGLLALAEAGVVRRRVYPELRVQRLATAGALDDLGRPRSVQHLLDAGVPAELDARSLAWLQAGGLLDGALQLRGDRLQLPDGRQLASVLSDPQTQAVLDDFLRPAAGGVVLHGGFFLGPADFYRRLRAMGPERLAHFAMCGIHFINELHGEEPLKRLQRRDARFVNSVFCMTLLGAAVADQLEDGRVLSGVGGQYNFVAQAHALDGARSILLLRSWREAAGRISSNIVWSYGHATIPRHLRDMVVTEYGIADLRGKNDAEVIGALLAISDSRFQPALITQAQQAGKLPRDFRLDPRLTDNLPWRLQALQARHPTLFDEYPLGCDFTAEERDLLRALHWLKPKTRLGILAALLKALVAAPPSDAFAAQLARMGLAQPCGVREALYRRLLLAGLQATRRESRPGQPPES
ncbi:acetyl-CoA hydrolase/transferase C-terminal domain-containing protein [Pseudomonas sp. 25A3E]|uniref:Acetyl-CoA hydrolase/transferase C-terminal domain-containing protein n=1 Tax=Pseudomonas zhanjiangensis TaxID=3239015 RepID=A0ABV3YP54_9PSED